MIVCPDKIEPHYDLKSALLENFLEMIGFEGQTIEVTEILGVIEGENDGASWHWVVSLSNGYYAYITGWCDYTGWG